MERKENACLWSCVGSLPSPSASIIRDKSSKYFLIPITKLPDKKQLTEGCVYSSSAFEGLEATVVLLASLLVTLSWQPGSRER